MRCFVVAGFLLTSASRGPSAIAEFLVCHGQNRDYLSRVSQRARGATKNSKGGHFGRHHLHPTCRCNLLIQISYTSWYVCRSVRECAVVSRTASCAKMAEPMEIPFGWEQTGVHGSKELAGIRRDPDGCPDASEWKRVGEQTIP